ncbi:MAG: tRNA (cytidine(56)-2'-O)-methyltransferase [Candidatus Bathyarchaeota archaeon]
MRQKEFKVVILRLGHRTFRDHRVTSHVALAARAFGADEVIIADSKDENVESTVKKVVKNWGGKFNVITGVSWKKVISNWKKSGGEIIHLTMYGLDVDNVIDQIVETGRDKMIVIGATKVPGELYKLADFNVSVTHQPHSEVSALAILLDRLFQGEELSKNFNSARISISSCANGKKIVRKRSG